MTGARRGRVTALAASAVTAAALLLALAGAPSYAQDGGDGGQGGQGGGGGGGPINCTIDPNQPECTTTTIADTTTTFVETTTSVVETTTTFTPAPTAGDVVQGTTSTSIEVSTSQDVLIRGDGTEGAESTTTTTVVPASIADDQADDGPLLALIVGGLLLLAAAVGILTWRYWAATRPPLLPAVGSDHG